MTPLGDYRNEMNTTRQIDDTTAEMLLTGGPVEHEFEALVPVVQAYRALGRQQVAPRGELAARMATGVFTSHASPGRVVVSQLERRGRSAMAKGKWRRARMAIISGLAAAAAKVAGLSAVAKASAGLTVAAASIGTAGVAGVLPDPVQDRFDTVVETVIPDESTATPDGNSDFGERVSEDARDGGVDGEEISEEARQLGDLHRPSDLPVPGPAGGVPSDLPTPDLPGGPGSAPEEPPLPVPPVPER
jgi:hypothetical protein